MNSDEMDGLAEWMRWHAEGGSSDYTISRRMHGRQVRGYKTADAVAALRKSAHGRQHLGNRSEAMAMLAWLLLDGEPEMVVRRKLFDYRVRPDPSAVTRAEDRRRIARAKATLQRYAKLTEAGL